MEKENIFDTLKNEYPKEWKICFRKLSSIISWGEANILLRVLRKQPCLYEFDLRWYSKFIDMLDQTKYHYNYETEKLL